MKRMKRWLGIMLSVMLAAESLQMPVYAAETGETAVEAAVEEESTESEEGLEGEEPEGDLVEENDDLSEAEEKEEEIIDPEPEEEIIDPEPEEEIIVPESKEETVTDTVTDENAPTVDAEPEQRANEQEPVIEVTGESTDRTACFNSIEEGDSDAPVSSYEDEDFTLNSNGTLVIRCNEGVCHRLFDEEWDPDIQDYVPITKQLFARTEFLFDDDFSDVTEYLNPNVKNIVVDEGNADGSEMISIYDLTWRFPNLEKITANILIGVGDKGSREGWSLYDDEDHPLLEETRMAVERLSQQWNSNYRNKLSSPIQKGDIFFIEMVSSKDLVIASYNYEVSGENYSNFKEEVENAGFTFKELGCELDKIMSAVANGSCFYDGESHIQAIKDYMYIKCENRDKHGEIDPKRSVVGKILTEGKHYTVDYYNERTKEHGDVTNAGSIKLTVTGINGHTGTLTSYYHIGQQGLLSELMSLDQTSFVYDGKEKKPTFTIVNRQGKKLVEGKDYRIVSYTDNVKIGTGKVLITGFGNYAGDASQTFKILPGKTSKVTTTNVASGIKVSWEKVPGATSYLVYRGSKQIFKTSALAVTDKEVKYNSGSKYVYKVVATTKDVGDSTEARTATMYRLMPVGIKSLTNPSAGKMTVTYDKSSGSSGYVVRYGLKSDMSDAKVITVKGEATTSRTFSGMQKGKTYYVQVRTYKIDNGVRYYSGYCTTKKIRIAK